MRTKTIVIALLAIGALLASAAQASAAAKPAWKFVISSQPTNFSPGAETGSEYFLVATNVGAAATDGPVTIEDTLPDGLVPIEVGSQLDTRGSKASATCAIDDQTVSCTFDEPIISGQPEVQPIFPGNQFQVQIKVKVELGGGTVQNTASIEGGGAPPAVASTTTTISPAPPPFGYLPGEEGLSAPLSADDGFFAAQAGSHPHQLTVDMAFPTKTEGGLLVGAGHPRDILVDLPPGEIVNPAAAPKCTMAQLSKASAVTAGCPDETQIGTVSTLTRIGNIPFSTTSPLFNMVPPPGSPSDFAFEPAKVSIVVHILGSVRSDGDYGLSGGVYDVLARGTNPILGARVQFWGDPAGTSHDHSRGVCDKVGEVQVVCPNEAPTGQTLLTAPTQCSGAQTITRGRVDSWEAPGVFEQASYGSADLGGTPAEISGCNQLDFEPSIEARPTTNLADSPSGLDFTLHQPTNLELDGLSPAIMRDTTVTLPQGMSVNPASAQGRAACASTDANFHNQQASNCPDTSKIASVEVTTPLLPNHPLSGAIYLAKPFDNPFGSLLAIYLAIDDPSTGTVATLAGKVTADPVTGQLTTRFTDNPQLPIEDIKIHFFTGPRAAFRTPATCGIYSTTTDITPWSAPETANAHPSDSFAISTAPGGGTCPSSTDQAPSSPSFSAGTISPQAGAYSPFVMKIKREDGTQPLAGIEATLAPGLIGKLAGVSECSEAQIAQAQSRNKPNEGALEISNPSCPAPSEVGEVDVASGAGITPLHVQGHAYLAGPYKGAPLSLVVITPAVAGPFDLGTVAVRVALHVDPETAQIKAISDPLPQILEGIPLDIRSVAVTMGRPSFTLNPTSCDPMSIKGKISSPFGANADLTSPFQVGGCNELAFKPKLSIRLKGQTKRTGHPALTATASFKPGQANTRFFQVTLPRSEFLDQAHIGTVCTRVQFKANQCPAASVYGEAEAITPLLDQPLKGLAYLRSSSNELPDLVIALKGKVDVVLAGRIDSVRGGIRTTFEAAPDAPVSKFTLKMRGGRKGLLINSANLCKLKPSQAQATVKTEGQNSKVHDFNPVVKSACGKAKKRHGHKGQKKNSR